MVESICQNFNINFGQPEKGHNFSISIWNWWKCKSNCYNYNGFIGANGVNASIRAFTIYKTK